MHAVMAGGDHGNAAAGKREPMPAVDVDDIRPGRRFAVAQNGRAKFGQVGVPAYVGFDAPCSKAINQSLNKHIRAAAGSDSWKPDFGSLLTHGFNGERVDSVDWLAMEPLSIGSRSSYSTVGTGITPG